MQPVGIEPTSTMLQTVAMTTSAKVALVPSARIELATNALSRRCTTAVLTRNKIGLCGWIRTNGSSLPRRDV